MRVCACTYPHYFIIMQFSLYAIVSMLLSIHTYSVECDTVLPNYLGDIDIVAERISSPIKNDGASTLKFDMEYMHRLPKILGNADPLRYTQMLPGVQTTSEIDAGIHIHGNDFSHNMVSLQGVPVYNPAHILGIFSVFNPTHFSQMAITKNVTAGDGCSRLGGIIDMELHNELPYKLKGDFAVGMMSSQGTLQIPLGKKAALFTSLRLSYLNLFYSGLLKMNDGQLKYTFGDVNVTYLQKIKENHTLHVNFYTGLDDVKMMDPSSKLYFNTGSQWGNMLGAAHWDYKYAGGNMKQSLYFTGYSNLLHVRGNFNLTMPSEIYDFGYRADASFRNFKFGVSLANLNVVPQSLSDEKNSLFDAGGYNRQKALEAALYVKYSGHIYRHFNYDIALKGDVYTRFKDTHPGTGSSNYNYQALNPSVKLGYENASFGNIELLYSTQHQYLLNCGFTSLGLPVEFWLAADAHNKPQLSHSLQLSYRRELFNGKYDISFEAYYKRLYNQVEYNLSPIDLLNKQYAVNDAIISGDGHNYGASIMVNKLTGKLTGWVAYSFGRALRRFGIYGDKWFPSNHERIHELNVVASYKINDRIDIGGTFSYASGTPYTKVMYMYLMNGNVLAQYGEHNSSRLKDYMRIDLSVNYDIIKKGSKIFGANLSFYSLNSLFRDNEMFYKIKVSETSFNLAASSYITSTLPSVSLYYKF